MLLTPWWQPVSRVAAVLCPTMHTQRSQALIHWHQRNLFVIGRCICRSFATPNGSISQDPGISFVQPANTLSKGGVHHLIAPPLRIHVVPTRGTSASGTRRKLETSVTAKPGKDGSISAALDSTLGMLTDTASGYGLRIDASSLRSEGRRQSRGPRQDTRPNFFIALQVSQHAAVTDAISRVQQAMISRNPVLHGCAVDARRAHLTLLVMRVEDDDDDRWRAACECLRALPARLQARGMLQPLQFALRGLSSFREQVLFLDVPKGPGRDGLIAFAEEVRSHFSDAQLLHPDSKPYVPHITVAKTSRLVDALGAEGARRVRISRELYEDLEAIDAGAVVVGSVQLCAMRGSGEDGYYPVEEMVSLESGQL